jgi:hypothetical protein
MIANPDRALLLEVRGTWCTVGVMNDHGRLTTLDDVDWHRVRVAESSDLRLAAPHTGIANSCTVMCIFSRANTAARASTVFTLYAREEWHEVIRVR